MNILNACTNPEDQIPFTVTENHQGSTILDKLRLQKDKGKFCDVIFHVQDKQYAAHRNVLAACSPYFDSLLKNDQITEEHLTIHCKNIEVFESILNYMYTGAMIISKNLMPELLRLANHFHIEFLKHRCIDYLERHVTTATCFAIKDQIERSGCQSLLHTVESFILCNIGEIVQHNEVLEFNYSKLEQLVSSKTYMLTENQRLTLIIHWVGYKITERTRYFRKMLTHVQWQTVNLHQVYELIQQDTLFQTSEYCLFHMLQVLQSNNLLWNYYADTLQQLSTKLSEMTGLDQEGLVKLAIAGAFDASDTQESEKNDDSIVTKMDPRPPDEGEEHTDTRDDKVEPTSDTSLTETYGAISVNDDLTLPAQESTCDFLDTAASQEVSVEEKPDDISKKQRRKRKGIPIKVKVKDEEETSLSNQKPRKRGRPPKSSVQYSSKLKKDVKVVRTEREENTEPTHHDFTRDKTKTRDRKESKNTEASELDVTTNKVNKKLLADQGNKSQSSHEQKCEFDSPKCNSDTPHASKPSIRKKRRHCKGAVGATTKKVKLKLVKKVISKCKKEKEKYELPCTKCEYIGLSMEKLDMHMKKAHKDDTTYTCNMCDFTCSWNREYYRHMKIHFNGPPYECDFEACDYIVDRIQPLLYHRMVHTDERPFECSVCNMSFRTRNNLATHSKCHTGEKPFECSTCGRSFATKGTLEQHSVTHSEVRPYLCDICAFSTKYQSHLKAHKRIHTGEKNFDCKKCGKKFAAKAHLAQHLLIHLNRRFLCDVCGFTTKVESHLKAHRRIHTGDVFKCQYAGCNYFTPKRSQLGAHMRVHLCIRSHVCSVCGRAFIEKSHLVRHERIHLDDKPFKCTKCDYGSTRRDKLKEHISKHHGQNGEAPTAKSPYKPRKQRKAQSESQPFQITSGHAYVPIEPHQDQMVDIQQQLTRQQHQQHQETASSQSQTDLGSSSQLVASAVAALDGQRFGLVLPTVVSVPPPTTANDVITPSHNEQQLSNPIDMADANPPQQGANLFVQQQQQHLIPQPVMVPSNQHDVTTLQTFGNLMGMWQ